MEQYLPDDAAVLGVDEHTAVFIDPDGDSVRVAGRGGLTVRRHGTSTVLPAGVTLTLTELRALAHEGTLDRALPRPVAQIAVTPPTVSEVAADCELRFDTALAGRDAAAMAQCVLDLESTVHDWSSDTEQDDGAEQARAVLRTLILRLAQAARAGLIDPVDRFRPLVEPLIAVRSQLRGRHDYASADAVRVALSAGGVELRDGPDGGQWSLRTA